MIQRLIAAWRTVQDQARTDVAVLDARAVFMLATQQGQAGCFASPVTDRNVVMRWYNVV